MALSPLPQPPSRFTLPPQQLLPSSFLKPSLLLPSPPLPRPDTTSFQPLGGSLSCHHFFFFFLFFFLYLAIFASPFSRKPRSLYVSLFCELQRQFAGGEGEGGTEKRGGGSPVAPAPHPCPPSPPGQGKRGGSGCAGVGAGSPEPQGGPCPRRVRVALRWPRWPRERWRGGGAALSDAAATVTAPGGSSPVGKPASTKVVPAPGEGPRNWPWPRSEAGGLLCCLPHHSLRSSPDRSKC